MLCYYSRFADQLLVGNNYGKGLLQPNGNLLYPNHKRPFLKPKPNGTLLFYSQIRKMLLYSLTLVPFFLLQLKQSLQLPILTPLLTLFTTHYNLQQLVSRFLFLDGRGRRVHGILDQQRLRALALLDYSLVA